MNKEEFEIIKDKIECLGGLEGVSLSLEYLDRISKDIELLESAEKKMICVQILETDYIHRETSPCIGVEVSEKIIKLILEDLKKREQGILMDILDLDTTIIELVK